MRQDPYNQRVNFPFGDAFLVSTPSLDRASNLLYQQQQNRQAQFQKYSSDMDSQLFQQLGNVKNVDIPEITDAWNSYRTSKQNLLFNKSLLRDPQAYAQAQIES